VAVTVSYPIDPLVLDRAIADGWTHLTLWYSNSPDGVYTNTAATPSPTTLALMASGKEYTATFNWSSGNSAQWFKIRAYNGVSYSDLPESSPFHGGGGTTLETLRRKLGREIRDMRVGTATTGTSTTSVVTTTMDVHRAPTGTYARWLLHNTSRGDWTSVTSSTRTTSTTLALDTAIASQAPGDAFELTMRFTPDEYRDALNWAVRASFPVLTKNIVNTGIRTAQNVYQYDVPHDIKSVHSVEIESWNNNQSANPSTKGHPWMDVPFRVIPDGLRKKIEFERWYDDGLRLRITGTGPLSQLYSDSDFVEVVDPATDLLIYYAAFHLFRGYAASGAASSDIDRYGEIAKHYFGMAKAIEASAMQSRPAKRGWAAEMRGSGPQRRYVGVGV
jgi:hypothetical protein